MNMRLYQRVEKRAEKKGVILFILSSMSNKTILQLITQCAVKADLVFENDG